MLSKNKEKLIRSLERKKTRDESGLFLVEGNKMVEEAIKAELPIELLIGTEEFLKTQQLSKESVKEIIVTDEASVKKISLLQTPQQALAILKQFPTNESPSLERELILALDCIQDPGNLGTILRIADWFGISTLVCSQDTVDVYNPKVVQASMGAIFRVNVMYCELVNFIQQAKNEAVPVYGTFLDGNNIYQQSLSANGILVMGNEGKGISKAVEGLVDNRLFIPSFAAKNKGSESLNVAVAAAICCSEFKRRTI